MSLSSTAEKRAERPDTKTLVRLGGYLSEPPPDPSQVELSFKGVLAPVRVRAERGPSGLQLRAALPFLELDSIVGIAASEDGAPQHARIRSVRISQGEGTKVPQLNVELTFGDAALDGELQVAAAAVHDAAPAPAATPERRARPFYLLGLGVLLGAALALGATSLRAPEARRSAVVPRAVAVAAAAAAALSAPTPAEATAEPSPSFAAPASPLQDSQAQDDAAAHVTVEADATEVLVPMSGDASGLRTYELSTPGFVVTLPHAQARGPLGNHRIVEGLVRRVWVQPAEPEGVQVRVITRRPATRSTVTFDDSGLHIALAH